MLKEKYLLYGLCVAAQLKLPVPLVRENNVPDVSVTIQNHCQPLKEAGSDQYYFSVSPKFAQFQYRDVALFTIKQGQGITVAPFDRDVDCDLLVNTLIGTPFGILLLQKGHLVFHSSAVEVDQKSVCFIGASGSGKSTTASSLISLGHRLISDDVVAFNLSAKPEVVPLPGYPWMKISTKGVLGLNLDVTMISSLQVSSLKKKYSLTRNRFAEKPAKLACIYILSWGNDLLIEPIKPKEAVLSLLANAYGFVPGSTYPQAEKKKFYQMMGFVKNIPCFRLQRPEKTDTVIEVGKIVEKHLSTVKKA